MVKIPLFDLFPDKKEIASLFRIFNNRKVLETFLLIYTPVSSLAVLVLSKGVIGMGKAISYGIIQFAITAIGSLLITNGDKREKEWLTWTGIFVLIISIVFFLFSMDKSVI